MLSSKFRKKTRMPALTTHIPYIVEVLVSANTKKGNKRLTAWKGIKFS